jgi:chemotaxis signal transduction protein
MRLPTSGSSVPGTEPLKPASGLIIEVAGVRRYIPIAGVIEVLRESNIIRVPGAVAAVKGMVNHRGRILTVADAIRALELPGDSGGGREIVVVQHGNRRFGIAVDAVIELAADARTGLAEIDLERIATAIFA